MIEALYRKLLTWEPLRAQEEGNPPELIVTAPPNGIKRLFFQIKDTPGNIWCQMIFAASIQAECDVPADGDDEEAADKETPVVHFQRFYDELAAVDHIVLYGNDFAKSMDKSEAERLAAHFQLDKKNTAVITFDWPCHGDDCSKSFQLKDCSRYLMRLSEYIHTRFYPKTFSVYAAGFGANQVLRYIRDHNNPFHRIILRSPTLNMYDAMVNHILSRENRKELLKGNDVNVGLRESMSKAQLMDFLSEDIELNSFAEYCDDLCIIHGTEDEIVSAESVRVFAYINQIHDDNLLFVERADHSFTVPAWMDEAFKKAVSFLFEERNLDSDSQALIIRKHIVFHGKVQDVGFRWRALAFASEVAATGWIRKNRDKTVTMEIQSTEARINRVITRLERVASIQIEKTEIKDIPAVAGEHRFCVVPNEPKKPASATETDENAVFAGQESTAAEPGYPRAKDDAYDCVSSERQIRSGG